MPHSNGVRAFQCREMPTSQKDQAVSGRNTGTQLGRTKAHTKPLKQTSQTGDLIEVAGAACRFQASGIIPK